MKIMIMANEVDEWRWMKLVSEVNEQKWFFNEFQEGIAETIFGSMKKK